MSEHRDLTHVGPEGLSRMVDVSGKDETEREAAASGHIQMSADALDRIRRNAIAKGDVLGVARVAGVMAAKRTAELIPMCHPLALTDVVVEATPADDPPRVEVSARVKTVGRTGVEMEAIVAVTIALVTIYDMAKSVDRQMTISGVHLDRKSGGRSGSWSLDRQG